MLKLYCFFWIHIVDFIADVVRAYKSLNAEKEALQTTIIALTGQDLSSQTCCKIGFLSGFEKFSVLKGLFWFFLFQKGMKYRLYYRTLVFLSYDRFVLETSSCAKSPQEISNDASTDNPSCTLVC